MKKILFALLAVSAVFFSCKEKTASGGENSKAPAKEQKLSPSRIIYSGWDLYEERSDGKMYAVKEAECGDEIFIYLNEDNTVEQKNAVRHLQSGKEEALDFIHVVYEDLSYWTRDIFTAGPNYYYSTVVLKDAFAYSAPDGGSLSGSQVAEGSFVAMENMSTPTNDFFKVVIYNGKPFGKEIWLKSENLAIGSGAVRTGEIVRVFSKINEKTPEKVRDEILLKLISESASWGTDESDYLAEKVLSLEKKNLLSEKVAESVKNIIPPHSISE
ncbi:MAG: hypothetical protein II821_06060 [Treponema sp.]|nr:hypothetical protein [Treponema sp.]